MDASETIRRAKAKAYQIRQKQIFEVPAASCADDTVTQAPFASMEQQRLQEKGKSLCCDCSGNQL